MNKIYAVGTDVIVAVQYIFSDYEDLFSAVNKLTDPHNVVNYIFPFISVFDSYFASDLLVTASIAKWVNAMLKWFLYEDRPYWWVKETNYYKTHRIDRPKLHTNFQTCETGPGNPSGHVMSTTVLLTLLTLWIISLRGRIFCRRKDAHYIYGICAVFFTTILLTSMSRMFVGAHFPHQCIVGSVIGILTAHAVSTYFVAPFMLLDETYKDKPKKLYVKCLRYQVLTNICLALCLIVIAFLFYWIMKVYGVDPVYSIKLAFKWCPSSSYLHYSSTPFYAFVISTGSILGWGLCVTPSVKSYRYNTKDKSYLIAIMSAMMFHQIFQQWHDSISKNDASYFYMVNLAAFTLRPFFFLRVVPLLATCRNKWAASKLVVKENIRMKDSKKNE